jgi:diguanylate cyclase (GGDEF)-like protein/PAS domain S-box-containing protein
MDDHDAAATPDRLQAVLATALLAQPVLAVDAAGRLRACSAAARTLLGLPADCVGAHVQACLAAPLARLFDAATPFADGERVLTGSDGHPSLRVSVQTVGDADGAPLRIATLVALPPRIAPSRELALRHMALAMEHSDSAIILVDDDLNVAHANAGFTRVFGYAEQDMLGRVAGEVLAGPHTDLEALAQIRAHVRQHSKFDAELLLYRNDGRPLWVSVISTPVNREHDTPYRWLTVLTDITHSKMHEVLHQRVLDALVREQPVGEVLKLICLELERVAPGLLASVLALDGDSRLRVSAAPSLPVEYTSVVDGIRVGPGAGACGTAAWRGKPVSVADTRTDPLFADYRDAVASHHLLACWSSPIKSSGGRVLGTFAVYYHDAREPDPWHIRLAEICLHLCALALEREQARARVHQLAFYDSLTALPNRMMFSARSEQLLVNAESREQSVAVMFLDVDRFKRVNETQGHAAGDGLLRDIAERVTGHLSGNDLVGRQAGDEFVLAMPQCNAEQAAAIAERLLGAISAPSVVGHMTLHPSASIGVAMFPDDGRDIDTLLRHADLAMHRAKTEGGGSFRFFSADMNRLAQERVALETALREAIRRDQLELHYQPQVHAQAPHQVHGVEVLLRWTHPQFGPVSPARFIPLAEESGLIDELGRWVLRTALAQLADWRARAVQVPRIAVNLSARNFEDADLLKELLLQLGQYGLQPDDVTLEMTESAMLSPQPGVLDNIHAMRDAGFLLSLDDFGTGYSSLSHLHHLPIGELKLDMAFVRDLEYSEAARALTNSVLRIGESLGKLIIAEGVENDHQRSLLAGLGCEVVQGFLFSRPLDAATLESWLDQHALAD